MEDHLSILMSLVALIVGASFGFVWRGREVEDDDSDSDDGSPNATLRNLHRKVTSSPSSPRLRL